MRAQVLSINEKSFWLAISALIFVVAWALCQLLILSHDSTDHSNTGHGALGHDAHHDHTGHTHSLSEDRLKHGKPGSNWYLVSAPVEQFALGATRTLNLSLNTAGSKGTVSIHLEHDEGIALLETQRQHTIELVGQVSIDVPATVYAAEQGEHLLHMLVQFTDEQGNSVSRSLATAIQVDMNEEALAQERNERRKSAANRDFIMLKAQEEIY